MVKQLLLLVSAEIYLSKLKFSISIDFCNCLELRLVCDNINLNSLFLSFRHLGIGSVYYEL